MTSATLPTTDLAPAPSTWTLDVGDLIAAVSGPVLTPGQPGYNEEVAGFNLAHQPSPALVVGATDAGDVAAAVIFARAAGLHVTVQATGHGLLDDLIGTLLVTTHRMVAVAVDATERKATIGAGVRWRAVIDAAAAHGLAPLCGSASGVGAVGYTLGGGTGILSRRYGFAADHVRSLVVVTGDGVVHQVDAEHEADLFWSIRGGKVGFGVVTQMVVDLVPVARFYGGGLFFPGAAAGEVLRAWTAWAATLPEEVTTSVAMLRLPPDPQLPPPLQGAFVTHLRYADLGTPEEAEARLEPMRAVAPVLLDTTGELPFAAVDAVHLDPPVPMPTHDRGCTLSALPEEAVQALVSTNGEWSDSHLALVEVRLMGGALAEAPDVANAVPSRDAAYGVYVLGVPAGPTAGTVPAQVDRVVDALRPWRHGALPNFLGHPGPGHWVRMWPEATRNRLMDVAHHYDPAGVFAGARPLEA
ncbi:FAD-binding oxidoreductase [uncultured Friedmanniella sp.]|uniref:FAD-binding oxidoreductase n=1 Tax=uncultured Friedmanniella sp. TaxID=335381 RepID=UPI0035CB9C0F